MSDKDGVSMNEAGELRLVGVLALLFRRARMIGLFAAFGLAVSLLVAVFWREYTAVARFMPHMTAEPGAGLIGLAAEFGLEIGGIGGTESAEFYAQLVRSRQLLRDAVTHVYKFDTGDVGYSSGDTLRGTLIELFDINESTRELATLKGVQELEDHVSVATNVEVGLVTVETRSRWPGLAAAINARLLALVNSYNLERRQSQASAERAFVAERVEGAERELNEAEGTLERFLTANRRYRGSPALVFEAEQLQRRVDLRQQVYLYLAQAYEEARIEEVRNTPVLTIVEEPLVMPWRWGEFVVRMVVGLVVGATIGVALVLGLAVIERQRAESPLEFEELADAMRSSLLGRLLKKRVQPAPAE
jgi:uncharacterized protein involved in exopolysaccharide biosynthesis